MILLILLILLVYFAADCSGMRAVAEAIWHKIPCRLFELVANCDANPSQIGAGILDAGAMLTAETFAKVQAAYVANQLPHVAPDKVSFPFWRLLFGLAPPGPGVDEMYETEAAQIFDRSANVDLAKAVETNPDGNPAQSLPPAQARQLRDAFTAEPTISDTLKAYLQTKAAALP